MLRVLVVDDEESIRCGLKNTIPWEDVGVGEVILASNGIEALQILESSQVDFIITDVQMPAMNGIELAKRVRASYPETDILMLSAHSSFEYAKSAIEYGVINYLVKPIVISSFIKELKKISHLVFRKKQLALQEQKAFKYTELLIEERLKTLLTGKALYEDELEEIRKFYGIHENSSAYYLIQIQPFSTSSKNCDDFPIHLLEQQSLRIQMEHREYIIICCSRFGEEKLLENIKNLSKGKEFLVAVSCRVSELGELYRVKEQIDCVNNRLFIGKENIVIYNADDGLRYANNGDNISKDILKKANQAHGIDFAFIDDFEEMMKGNHMSTKEIKRLSVAIVNMFMKNCLQRGVYSKVSCEYDELLVRINQSQKLDCLIHHLKDFISNSHKKIELHSCNSKHRIVNEVKEYINTHYVEDIGVKSIAHLIGRSPNYLSHLFSDTCGKTLSEYLNEMRIENAKHLLIETDDTLYSISIDVGYKDDKYFIKMFKKLNGMTPTQYRGLFKNCI